MRVELCFNCPTKKKELLKILNEGVFTEIVGFEMNYLYFHEDK